MPTNEMLDRYIYRDKTSMDRLWINPRNIYIYIYVYIYIYMFENL
jgi:hypothetical protein